MHFDDVKSLIALSHHVHQPGKTGNTGHELAGTAAKPTGCEFCRWRRQAGVIFLAVNIRKPGQGPHVPHLFNFPPDTHSRRVHRAWPGLFRSLFAGPVLFFRRAGGHWADTVGIGQHTMVAGRADAHIMKGPAGGDDAAAKANPWPRSRAHPDRTETRI